MSVSLSNLSRVMPVMSQEITHPISQEYDSIQTDSGTITKRHGICIDDDSDSDSDSDMSEMFSNHFAVCEDQLKKAIYELEGLTITLAAEGLVADCLMYADAVWDRVALESDELGFRVGDVIEILDMSDDVWWHGSVEDNAGWFPASFVRLRIGQDSENEDTDSLNSESPGVCTFSTSTATTESSADNLGQMNRLSDPTPDSSSQPTVNADVVPGQKSINLTFPRQQQSGSVRRRMTIRRKDSSNSSQPRKLSSVEVRSKVVEEILNTERDYVQHLEDIIEGFLRRCREYNKLFDDERVDIIFSNIEQVFSLQRDFLKELEARINHDHMELSQIGEVFVMNRHEFRVYSQYCNNHPHAVNEMNMLHQNEQYTFFFESCRLLRNLQDISLEGFLLTPVQKICKYPLQLSELLKYTSEDHPDYPHVVAAQEAMKEVAMLINEQKRRMENVGKIGRWQETIDGWKGDDTLERSTELIHSGELHKISKGHSQERHFFLFDHQLVYCKKDAIGGKLSFKGRVDMDNCQITDLADGSAMHGNNPVKNGWRMNNKAKDNKWYIIYAKSPEVKKQWMGAFQRERKRVEEDEEKGFRVSMKMKRAAVSLCASTSEARRRRRSFHKKHVAISESVDSAVRTNRTESSVTISGNTQPIASKRNKKKQHTQSVSSSTKIY